MAENVEPVSAAERQRAFKQRMRDSGFKQCNDWINRKDLESGAVAARSGADPLSPPKNVHVASWQYGFLKEWRRTHCCILGGKNKWRR